MVAGDLPDLIKSWRRHLKARNLAGKTITTYLDSANQMVAFMAGTGRSLDAAEITRADLEAFVADILSRRAASTASVRFRAVRQLFKWLEEEEEIDISPMVRMKKPRVEERQIPVISADDIRALLKLCDGRDFESRRDRALILFVLDTGARLSEVAALQFEEFDLDRETAFVLGKGRVERTLVFEPKTAAALDRYLRERRRHREVGSPAFWLGKRGRLSSSGIAQMMKRRSADAGIERVHPHR